MKYLLFLISFCCMSSLMAQDLISVKGVLVDSTNGEALLGANLALESAYDASKIYGASSDASGKFELKVPSGAYRLKVSFLGYKSYQKRVFVQTTAIDLGKIELAQDAIVNEEIEVEGKIPPVILKGDTAEYNSQAFKTNPDASAEDLLKKMPGIDVSGGKVQAQGEDVKQVLVDGKPFFGEDAKTTLKNIPSEMVDKVQVYDQKSEQSQFSGFNDGEDSKVINIISKPEYRSGTFGRVYAGGGYDDDFQAGGERYNAGGVLNSFKDKQRITLLGQFNNINEQNFSSQDLAGVMGGGGRRGGGWRGGGNVGNFLVDNQGGITATNAAGINYSDEWGKKIDVTGSYFFNYTDNSLQDSLYRTFISSRDSGQFYTEGTNANSGNMNHRASFRFNYKIDDKNSILIQPQFTMQMNNGEELTAAETFGEEFLISQTLNNFNSKVNAWNFRNRILLQHRFKKRGRTISLSSDQRLNSNNAVSNLYSYNDFIFQGFSDSLDQEATLAQYEQTYSARLEYTEPLGKVMQLQLRYDPSFSINDGDRQTMNYNPADENYNMLDTALSNTSVNYYNTHTAGAGIRYFKKKTMLMLRANFQYAQLKTEQTYPYALDTAYNFYSVLPFLMFRHTISKGKKFMLFYRSNTDNPSISQLQEVVDNSNPLQLSMGNAALQQSMNHRVFMRYATTNLEKNLMFFTMLMGNYTHNPIGNSTFIAFQDTTINGVNLPRGTQLNQPVNLSNNFNIRTYNSFGMPLEFIKSNLKLNFSLSYTRTPGLINNELNYAHTPNGSLGLTLSSNISEKLDFTISTNSSLNYSINSLNTNSNSRFLNQNSELRFYWNPWKTLVLRTDMVHQYFSGLSDAFNTSYLLWNASISTKVFKNKQGEISFIVYDILNQNNSINREITEIFVEDSRTNVLQRYLMLQFTYKFKPKNANIDMEKDMKDVERYRQYRKYHK
jgi:hypothetical protein